MGVGFSVLRVRNPHRIGREGFERLVGIDCHDAAAKVTVGLRIIRDMWNHFSGRVYDGAIDQCDPGPGVLSAECQCDDGQPSYCVYMGVNSAKADKPLLQQKENK